MSAELDPNITVAWPKLLHQWPDAVICAGVDGTIKFWNASAERIFGFSAREAIGQSLDIVIPQKLRARHWQGFERAMRSGTTRYGNSDILAVPALRKDGTRISIEFTILLLRDDDARLIGIAASVRDVTKRFEEIKALRRELAASGSSARSTGQAK